MGTPNRRRVREAIRDFKFAELFNELGWDRTKAERLRLDVDGVAFNLNPVAEKRGLVAYEVRHESSDIPTYDTRRRLEAIVAKLKHEHVLIFVDQAKKHQQWLWVHRLGAKRRFREAGYEVGTSGEDIAQRLEAVAFAIEEEEELTLVEVTRRIGASFVDKVTKAFYDRFKQEHVAFLRFIKGFQNQADAEWYASLMLNRLMFIYFIQKRGFLANDIHYLRNRLARVRSLLGSDKFHTFYRHFLIRLFHEGLGQTARTPELDDLLGKVPYLNGGLFDVHQLELENIDIDIPDAAFEQVFEFFDGYQWHLDDRPMRNDNEINPDVLGYIFEKYVNQKQMGAYYTKEDVTEYMVRSTVLPFLLEGASLVSVADLPAHAYQAATLESEGVDSESATTAAAADPAADGSVSRHSNGDVLLGSFDDFITLGLDLKEAANDSVKRCNSSEALSAFYDKLRTTTILDPTCGSGAFLFAALNLLEPLYESCLERMRTFLDRKLPFPEASRFQEVLADVATHPNTRYFIIKSAIVNNLFGVDIMEEAVEICKLRLFLRLVSQVNHVSELEPLPDIDFNIRCGNTLVGIADQPALARALSEIQASLDFDRSEATITSGAAAAGKAFSDFRRLQTLYDSDPDKLGRAKANLKQALAQLASVLDTEVARRYGVARTSASRWKKWHTGHQPFHWLTEFYEAVQGGGFDVIVGNPPYVHYSKVKDQYTIVDFASEKCGNLYGFVIERSLALLRPGGRLGMIVPLSITFSRDFDSVRRLLLNGLMVSHYSSYDNIPDRLFTGAKESDNTSKQNQQRVTILTGKRGARGQVFSTPTLRWKAEERSQLFSSLPFIDVTALATDASIPKVGSERTLAFLDRWLHARSTLGDQLREDGQFSLVVPRTAGYYIAAYPTELERTKQMTLRFATAADRDFAMVLLNSNAFFWVWRALGDGFDVTSYQIKACPFFSRENHDYTPIAAHLRAAVAQCSVTKGYRGKRVPNVNFNLRMDLLSDADGWILRSFVPDLELSPSDFLWAKSNSFLSLEVPKSDGLDKA